MKKTFLLILFISFWAIGQNKNVFDIARKGTLNEIKACYKEHPESINSVDANKYSPLVLACYRGNVAVAQFLIDNVKDINYNSGMGSALMAAVMSGNSEIVEKLIAKKADLNLSDGQGKTALIYATFFNKNDIAKLLLLGGANANQKDNEDQKALDYANFNKNTELIILLNKY